MKYIIQVYKTKIFRQWRWRIKSKGNNKIIASSSESFNSRENCINNLNHTYKALEEWQLLQKTVQENSN